jgi:hypothetical protein
MAYQQGPPGQPPHYGPPPGYGYPSPPPKNGKSPLFWIFVVGLPLAILLSCTAAVAVIGSSGTPQPVAAPAETRTSHQPKAAEQPAEQPAQQTEQSKPAEPVVLISAEGSGTKNTAQFTADATWELRYTFDCANFGIKGNFIVAIQDAQNNMVDVAVNVLADKGEDKTPLYSAGTFHLEVTSPCAWKITAVDLP